ncbi:hypothetical protein, partial [Liquorilactobacillus hordei]|uniref:hypothetical protein n=1 Tax=Liquorilactobacillus hordei TaxID=468911 RepID=UPI001F274541
PCRMIFFWFPVSFDTKYSQIYVIIIVHFDYPFYRGIVCKGAGCNRCFFIFNYTKRASPEKSLLSLVKLFHLGLMAQPLFLLLIR